MECYQLTYDLIEALFTDLAYFKRLTVVGKDIKSTFLMSKREIKSGNMFKIEKIVGKIVGKNIENFSSFQNFIERLKVLLAKLSVEQLEITGDVNKQRKLLKINELNSLSESLNFVCNNRIVNSTELSYFLSS